MWTMNVISIRLAKKVDRYLILGWLVGCEWAGGEGGGGRDGRAHHALGAHHVDPVGRVHDRLKHGLPRGSRLPRTVVFFIHNVPK